MIGLLAFERTPLGRVAMIALATLVLVGALWLILKRHDRSVIRDDRAASNAAAATIQAKAQDKAASERLTDDRASRQTEQELTDAVAPVADTPPDAARVALGCARLRRAGAREADLPRGCRPAGGG
jgi:hypothetical protein